MLAPAMVDVHPINRLGERGNCGFRWLAPHLLYCSVGRRASVVQYLTGKPVRTVTTFILKIIFSFDLDVFALSSQKQNKFNFGNTSALF